MAYETHRGAAVAVWEEQAQEGYDRYAFAGLRANGEPRFVQSEGFLKGSGIETMAREIVDCVKLCLQDCPASRIPRIIHNMVPKDTSKRGFPLSREKERQLQTAIRNYLLQRN
jgi:hypothetical protein